MQLGDILNSDRNALSDAMHQSVNFYNDEYDRVMSIINDHAKTYRQIMDKIGTYFDGEELTEGAVETLLNITYKELIPLCVRAGYIDELKRFLCVHPAIKDDVLKDRDPYVSMIKETALNGLEIFEKAKDAYKFADMMDAVDSTQKFLDKDYAALKDPEKTLDDALKMSEDRENSK